MDDTKIKYVDLDGSEKECSLKKPTFLQMTQAIEEYGDAVVSDIVGYQPLMAKFLFEVKMVELYTDIKLPDDINECFEYLSNVNILESLWSVAPLEYMREAADEILEYRIQKDLSNTPLTELVNSLSGLFNTLQKEFDGVDIKDVMEKFGGILEMYKDMPQEKIAENILKLEKQK